MSARGGRTYILEPLADGEVPEAELDRLYVHLKGTLLAVGGEFTVRADRVKVGELPGPTMPCGKCGATGEKDYSQGKGLEPCRSCKGSGVKQGPPDVLSQTLGFFVEWRNVPRLSDEPMTARALDFALGEQEQNPDAPAKRADPPSEAEIVAALAATADDGDEIDDEPDQGEED